MESKQGVIKIDARMEKLQPATKFGPEYLTYVMWAITPEGRATNVGEVLLNGGKSKLDATTELQSFGLIVTAEPYFAVTQPSDVVVMENFVRQRHGRHHRTSRRQVRTPAAGPVHPEREPGRDQAAWPLDSKVPLELYEARNAVQIARWTGAEHVRPRDLPEGRRRSGERRGLSEGQSREASPLARWRVRPSKWPKMPASSP